MHASGSFFVLTEMKREERKQRLEKKWIGENLEQRRRRVEKKWPAEEVTGKSRSREMHEWRDAERMQRSGLEEIAQRVE